MPSSRDVESAERVIPQPPEAIFALLADPSRHADIDGSGSVRPAEPTSQRVKLGDTFDMPMKLGVRYTTHNTVVEFEDDRRIAWSHSSSGLLGKLLGPGAIWRYELEPVGEGTRVRETWDFSPIKLFKPLVRLPKSRRDARAGMEKTLENIEKLLAS
jgi:uncharacterized protein YndB with AHSA1/START domain